MIVSPMPATEEDVTPPRKSGSWKSILLLVAFLLLSAMALLFWWDDRPDPAADLQPRHAYLKARSDNGFVQLTDKWAKYPDPDSLQAYKVLDMMSGGKAWDQAAADALNPARISFSEDLEQALAAKEWQLQTALPDGGVNMDATMCYYRKNRLACFHAVSCFRQQKSGEAFLLWDRILQAAQHSFAGSTSLVDASISLAMLTQTAQPALDAAGQSADQVPDAMMAKLQDRLLGVQITPEDLSEVMRHEAVWRAAAVRKFRREGPDPEAQRLLLDLVKYQKFARFFLKPNRTINIGLAMLRRAEPRLLRAAATKEEAWPSDLMKGLVPEPGRMEWLNPNRTGLAMVRQDEGIYRNYDNMCRASLAVLRSTAVCIALRRWQRDHDGELPVALGELVPGFLNEIPQDPFDGKPLRWDTIHKVVYSIGSDWIDDLPLFEPPFSDKRRTAGRFTQSNEDPGVRLEIPVIP